MPLTGWAAASLTAVAVAAWSPRWAGRLRLDVESQRRRAATPLGLAVPLAVTASVLVVDVTTALLGLAASMIAGTSFWRWRSARRRTASRRRAAAMTELVLVLAAALRSGLPAATALSHAAQELPRVAPAAHAARQAGDVPQALRSAIRGPGDEGLERLAVAWQVADATGAPLADVLDRLGALERQERELRREILAGVSPARATALLMAMLPVFGLVLGAGMGDEPAWRLMTLHPLVAGAVALGVTLACGGMLWIDRIADAAEAA